MRYRPLLVLCALALVVLASCDAVLEGTSDGRTPITLLVVYTPGARDTLAARGEDIEAHIRQAVTETNAVYAYGRIPLRLDLVHVAQVEHTVEDRFASLRALIDTDDGVLDEVHGLRDEHEADVVVLVPGSRSTMNGAFMAEPKTAFALVWWDGMGAPTYAMGHEIGHLQGARHDEANDPLLEPFAYGHGFTNDSLRTIMGTGPQTVVPLFSGPDQVYRGVVLGDTARQDVARVLRASAVYVSNFRGPQTPTDFVPPALFPRFPDL